MVRVIRQAVFRIARGIGGLLPPSVLAVLLVPAALARALVEIGAHRGGRRPRSLPPGKPASLAVELGARTSAWLNTAALLWADRFAASPWRQRLDVAEVGRLRDIGATRPLLIATIHFGGIFVMPSLLRSCGIPTAAVVGEKLWPVRWWRARRAELTQIDGLPAHLRAGDARSMTRYMQPGRCLLVALDYPLGEQVEASFRGASLRLSTPSLRLARITHAVVVPMIVSVDGLWRYSVRVGKPVPDEMLASGDDAAVVAHVVDELLPIAATHPEQALPLLVNAFTRPVDA